MRKTVADVMTSDPYVVSRDAFAFEAARMMDEQNVGSVPVVDGDSLVGIVTDRDLAVRVVAAGLDPKQTTVGDIATANLHSATAGRVARRGLRADGRVARPPDPCRRPGRARSSGCSPRRTSSTS